jgi:hypothetical protein
MLILKRLLLLVMIAVVPLALTAASYWGALYVLAATHRVISADTIRLVTIVEFAGFFFIALLEAKARWSARPSN